MLPENEPQSVGQSPADHFRIDPKWLIAIIGQAAVIVAIVVAAAYAAGALSLAFKLWYDRLPILPVLVQLPRTWSISQAVTVILPIATGIGLLTVAAWNRYRESWIGKHLRSNTPKLGLRGWGISFRWGVSFIIGLALMGSTLLFAKVAWISPIPTKATETSVGAFPRSWWSVAILFFALDTVLIRLMLFFCQKASRFAQGTWRDVLRVAAVALAFIPILASISAAYSFPIVKLCSAQFTHPTQPGQHGHYYTLGNLIGVSGQYVYVAQTLTKRKRGTGASTEPGQLVYATSYISVFPLSEIKMMAIGENASCGPFAHPGSGVVGTVP